MSQFGQRRGQAQKKYREFVAAGLGDRPWEKLRGQIFLGSEEAQRRAVRPTLEQILGKKTGSRSVEVAYREYGYRMNEIAQYLGVHYATVSRRLKASEGKRR